MYLKTDKEWKKELAQYGQVYEVLGFSVLTQAQRDEFFEQMSQALVNARGLSMLRAMDWSSANILRHLHAEYPIISFQVSASGRLYAVDLEAFAPVLRSFVKGFASRNSVRLIVRTVGTASSAEKRK
ncbi:MAG: hypothetical protein HYU64_09810 [Armatimonadetes bacterium]|nr:hypothetical protein [Armatimonadota bacterium]